MSQITCPLTTCINNGVTCALRQVTLQEVILTDFKGREFSALICEQFETVEGKKELK